eukprot:gene1425-1549_t
MLFGTKVMGTLILGVTLLIYFNQEKILYIPNPPGIPKTPEENPPGFVSPNDWNQHGALRREHEAAIHFEEHYIETKDKVRIHSWLMLHDQEEDASPRPVLIYFHGNAANMGFRLPNAAKMFHYAKINILMVDYRGYGNSEGAPSEQGLQQDAEAVLDFITKHPRLQGSPVIPFGRSLGGAVAIYLAHRFPGSVAAVVVENTFLSISAMTDLLMPIVRPIKPLLLRMYWDSDRLIQELHQPILFISGQQDELVPSWQMRQLHKLAVKSQKADLYQVPNGHHNDTWEVAGVSYYKRLRAFIEENVLKSSSPAEKEAEPASSSSEDVPVQEADSSGMEQNKQAEETEVQVENEEEEYFIVNSQAIPTMGRDFQVR